MHLMAQFQDSEAAAVAVGALRARGLDPDDIAVFSGVPVEFPPGVLDRPSRMSLLAVAGGVSLCLLATGFLYYTQHDYKLITGGMPLFSMWATGVISYEMTMLGAIAATFLMFLWESGLLRRRNAGPTPVIDPGRIALRVRCRQDNVTAAGEALYRAGAARVEKIE